MEPSQRTLDNDVEPPDKRVLRRRTLKKAIASYNNQAISMEVILRDISDTGAKIKLKDNDILPDLFYLFVEIDAIGVECKVIWRRGREIGAKFISEVQQVRAGRTQVVDPTIDRTKVSILRKRPTS